MVIFIDTSSLIKRYVYERGSDRIDAYFNESNTIWISPVTLLEMSAALKRKENEGSIDAETFEKALEYFQKDYLNYSIVRFNDELMAQAMDIIKNHSIKTLDSIQIASGLLSASEVFLTSDKKMSSVLDSLFDGELVLI